MPNTVLAQQAHNNKIGQAGASISGNLSGMPLYEVLTILEAGGKTGLLKMTINNNSDAPSTFLAIKNGKIGRIKSAFLPSWEKSLLNLGIPEVDLKSYFGQRLSIVSIIEKLLANGLLSKQQISELLKYRMMMALLPIFHCDDGYFSFSPENVDSGYIEPGIHATALSLEMNHRLDELKNISSIEFNPSQKYKLSNLIGDFSDRIKDLNKTDWMLISIFAEEMNLAQASRKSHLLWNELILSVRKLEHMGLLGLVNTQETKKSLRLKSSDSAPPFSLPDLNGNLVSLGAYRGQKLLISINRTADCPICNPHIQSLIEAYSALQEQGIEVIAIFNSSLENLQNHVGLLKPPFPLLADEDATTHESYGLSKSLFGLMSPQNMSLMKRGMKMQGTAMKMQKEILTMPAEFLVNKDLSIYKAHYNAYAADFLSLEEVMQFGSSR